MCKPGSGLFRADIEEALQPPDIGFGRGGHDAIHHGAGKGAFGLDPACKLRVHTRGEFQHDAAQHRAVFGKVVAAQDGKGRDARNEAAIKRAAKEAGRGDRTRRAVRSTRRST
jgi:hypothetical protein